MRTPRPFGGSRRGGSKEAGRDGPKGAATTLMGNGWLRESPLNVWPQAFDIRGRSALRKCMFLPAMPGAKEVAPPVSAAAVAKARSGMGAYTASKAGVLKLTEALADELKDRGITVNAVLPSVIDTPANRKDMPKADFTRWVTPSDIASVIVFLLSDEARAVTGALIPVSGRV